MARPSENSPDLFPPDEPPTFPRRTSSNEAIRYDVIRPMLQQYQAQKKTNDALDQAVRAIREAINEGSIPPPPPNGDAEERQGT